MFYIIIQDTVTIEFQTEVNTVTQEKKEELRRLMIMRRCVIKMHFAVTQTVCSAREYLIRLLGLENDDV